MGKMGSLVSKISEYIGGELVIVIQGMKANVQWDSEGPCTNFLRQKAKAEKVPAKMRHWDQVLNLPGKGVGLGKVWVRF